VTTTFTHLAYHAAKGNETNRVHILHSGTGVGRPPWQQLAPNGGNAARVLTSIFVGLVSIDVTLKHTR
jgi:hypothetical protein